MSQCQSSSNDGCHALINAKCIVYKGPNLRNIDVFKYDNLQEILISINDVIAQTTLYTASNLGSGTEVYAGMSGNNFQFKTLVEGSNITITHNGATVTISSTGGISTDEKVKISSLDTTEGFLENKLIEGQGVIISKNNPGGDENLEITLDLEATTLVIPVITALWSVYKSDGTTLITTSSSANIIVESGSKVGISSTYLYPTPSAGEASPTSVSGSYGTTLFPPATPSSPTFTNGGVQITTNTIFSQTLSKAKSGLIVVGSQVEFATGSDTTSASISTTFLPASYFGYSTNTSLTNSQIKALGNKNLQSSRARFLSGVTAGATEYTYYCYPASYGALTNVIQNSSLPILGAFTRLTDVSITADSGVSVLMSVYKSNATNAFTSVTLDFS